MYKIDDEMRNVIVCIGILNTSYRVEQETVGMNGYLWIISCYASFVQFRLAQLQKLCLLLVISSS